MLYQIYDAQFRDMTYCHQNIIRDWRAEQIYHGRLQDEAVYYLERRIWCFYLKIFGRLYRLVTFSLLETE